MVAERAKEKRVLRVRVEPLSEDRAGISGALQGVAGGGETEAKGINLGGLETEFEGLMGGERGRKMGVKVKIGKLGFRGGRWSKGRGRMVWLLSNDMFGKIFFLRFTRQTKGRERIKI
ncbi:hypothetical protein J1N35_021356 [Gossypium stocksii]|uniref:Uncharacterized protein n=1 Tax=Gossypium stocksii TaxID=47602 RepID=A0A9D4A1W2_9ROSI|nr:hypothetical protein J1N35_021356 [Gossypium stocksii]